MALRASTRAPLLCLLLLATLVALLPAPTTASAAPAPLPPGCTSAADPLVVEVTTLLPRAPRSPEEPFQIAGRLRNCSTVTHTAIQLRLSAGGRITTRFDLQARADSPVPAPRLVRSITPARDTLLPGESTSFDLRLLTGELRLRAGLGVYPITLAARSRAGEDRRRAQSGSVSTFVPWFPTLPAPTRIAWLWPLTAAPARTPDEVFLDDRLATLLDPTTKPRGRLQELLLAAREGAKGGCDASAAPPLGSARSPRPPCAPQPVPLTYALDPALLHAVEAMSAQNGYQLLTPRREARPRSQAALLWLRELRELAEEGDVLALPFADPELSEITARPDLQGEARDLYLLGQAETRRILYPDPAARRPLADLRWLPGPLTRDALAALEPTPLTALVLGDGALVPPPPVSRTPSTRVLLPSSLPVRTGLVPEPVLASLLSPDVTSWDGPRLAEQRFIAETAMIAAEAPNLSRTILVAPPRAASIVPSLGAAAIMSSQRLPWLCPVALRDVAAGTERCTPRDTQPPLPPPSLTEAALLPPVPSLPRPFLERLAALHAATSQLTDDVLVADSPEARATRARLLRAQGRAASSAWREDPAVSARLLRDLERDVTAIRSRVRLRAAPVTLTGRTGVIEFVVENQLDQPVRLGVELDDTAAARLSSRDTGLQLLAPRSATQISVRVEPQTSGRFEVLATLTDAEGHPFGPPVPLQVRSAYYGPLPLVLTGFAALVLFAAAARRIFHRVRTHRQNLRATSS